MNPITWHSGQFVDAGAPAISADDEGFLSGRGVFETLRLHGGVALCRTRHLARLARSAAIVGVAPQLAAVGAGIDAVTERYGRADGRLRATVTAGGSVVVSAGPLPPAAAAAAVMVSPWRRNEAGPLAGAKSTSYADNLAAQRHAQSLGFDEAVMLNTKGMLCEGTRSNIFVAIGSTIATPPLQSGCLGGIVRALAVEQGLAVERDLAPADLAVAGEAFFTSSLRIVQPISRVGARLLAPTPGPRTAHVRAALDELLAANPDA